MSDTLYDADILVWSEQQADLLRRAARGERVNGLDWPNLIEEIEAVGRAELHAVESLLGQALLHLLKTTGWPDCDAASHWRGEALGFLLRAARQFTPSMRQRIDLGGVYQDALAQARIYRIDRTPPRPLPDTCPLTLDELLSRPADAEPFIARFAAAVGR